eukprot:gene284-157_t
MYEEAERKRKEEAQQNAAAMVIQQQWRMFLLRKEDEQELQRNFRTRRGDPDASNAVEAVLTDDEQVRVLMSEYRTLLEERNNLVERNLAAQRIAAKQFMYQRIRKGESELGEPVTIEAEENYWSAVRKMAEERRRVMTKKLLAEQDLESQRQYFQGTIEEATRQEESFRDYIRDVASRAVFMRTSSAFPPEVMEQFMETEREQRNTIRSARVRYIQLRNFLRKLSRSASDNDHNHEGMYLIDFEQLKIENTNLNEKIEERNEDLVKLRRKVTTTIHVLTHVKEKLEFMKGENALLRQQVLATEEELNGVRDQLAQTKRRRDGFLKANLRMKEKMPLVGSEDLLMDYELRKGAINQTRIKVVELTELHQQLLNEIAKQQPTLEKLRREISRCPT